MIASVSQAEGARSFNPLFVWNLPLETLDELRIMRDSSNGDLRFPDGSRLLHRDDNWIVVI